MPSAGTVKNKVQKLHFCSKCKKIKLAVKFKFRFSPAKGTIL